METYNKFAELLDRAETSLGGGAQFYDVCGPLIRNAPDDASVTVTVPMVTLQNILRAAFRELLTFRPRE